MQVILGHTYGKLKNLSPALASQISDACSYEIQGSEHSPLYKRGHWDGKKRLYNKQTGKFPMGMWERISHILNRLNAEYTLVDQRNNVRGQLDLMLSETVEKRQYQQEAVGKAIDARRSVIQAATGAGKTVMAAMLIVELKCTTLFLVHTKDLLYQAKQSFEAFIKGDDAKIGQVGDGVIDIRQITVATMQTMSRFLGVKYEKYKYEDVDDKEKAIEVDNNTKVQLQKMVDSTELVIWDEVHRIACNMAFGVSEKIEHAPYRVGLSASPWRDDGADMLIEAAMGHTSYIINASDLIDMGYLVQPIIKIENIPASQPWWSDNRSYDQIYKEEIVENRYRNERIIQYVKDFLTMDIMTLVLVQQIKHGNMLKRRITDEFDPIDFLSGRDLSIVRNRTIQEMRDGERLGLIASTIADEGLDIKRLSAVILAGGGKSSTRALQRIGRVLRTFEGKTHALVVDFNDEAKYLRDHAQRRQAIYQTEPRFAILRLE